MFSLKRKLDKNLNYYLSHRSFNTYRVLIKCKSLLNQIAKKVSKYKGTLIYSLEYSNIICASLNGKAIESLIEYPEVTHITLDSFLFLCGSSIRSSNKFTPSEALNLTGRGIGVGIVDSGVFPHPDLLYPSNKIVRFIDLINNITYPYDDNGHGTSICGIIAGSGISSNNVFTGIATQSDLVCYKAFDKHGKGYASAILYALECLIKESSDYNIKILCLPFELLSYDFFIIDCFDLTFKKAISIGITPIVPSGSILNSYKSISGISILSSCITVGASDYIYSSEGKINKTIKPDLKAPCLEISCLNCNTSYISEKNGKKLYPHKLQHSYISLSGTSISAAYISGLCALLYQKDPCFTFNDIRSMLLLSKDDNCAGLINVSSLLS